MFSLWGSPTVHVTLVDAEQNQPLAEVSVRLDQLPKQFQADTVMFLNEEQWHIVSATPNTAEDIGKCKQLTLVVSKMNGDWLNPSNLLCSLPTLFDPLPPLKRSKIDPESIFYLHPDDWRNLEWVSKAHLPTINEELDGVRAILNEEGVDLGDGLVAYRRLHVRTTPSAPLSDRMFTLDDLLTLLPGANESPGGLGWLDEPGVVTHGFALKTVEGLVLYGLTESEKSRKVTVLGLELANWHPAGAREVLFKLDAFTHAHGLTLVDWCGARHGGVISLFGMVEEED